MSNETNPLLIDGFRVPFQRIRAEHVEPGIREVLRRGEERLEAIAASGEPPGWSNVMEPLDLMVQWVGERITPASHLVSVAETPELREAYNAVLPEISAVHAPFISW